MNGQNRFLSFSFCCPFSQSMKSLTKENENIFLYGFIKLISTDKKWNSWFVVLSYQYLINKLLLF